MGNPNLGWSDPGSLGIYLMKDFQGAAARARRISAGIEREPVFFITAARWFSTVRWLTPRSAAMFLLGWPASTRSMTSRWRAVRPAIELAAFSRQADAF